MDATEKKILTQASQNYFISIRHNNRKPDRLDYLLRKAVKKMVDKPDR